MQDCTTYVIWLKLKSYHLFIIHDFNFNKTSLTNLVLIFFFYIYYIYIYRILFKKK